MISTISTEKKILIAAKAVFTKKGFAAARMQEIADTAEINKGLLHYYFRSKEKLFDAVFEEALLEFIPQMNEIFESELPLFQKIEHFVENYINFILKNPQLPIFIINELNQNPNIFIEKMKKRNAFPNPMKLMMQIQTEVQRGNIREINPVQLVVHILSMCAFPFLAKPMLETVLHLDDSSYIPFLQSRKKEIVSFVKHAIQK